MKKTFLIILSLCITSCSYMTSQDFPSKENTQVSPYYNPNCKSSHNMPDYYPTSAESSQKSYPHPQPHPQFYNSEHNCQGFTD